VTNIQLGTYSSAAINWTQQAFRKKYTNIKQLATNISLGSISKCEPFASQNISHMVAQVKTRQVRHEETDLEKVNMDIALLF